MRHLLAAAALAALPFAAQAEAPDIPAAIYTDPPADREHPAAMEVVHIPSGGVESNGVVYVAAGAGPHPTAVLCHGLPGLEKNLDLAQAIRRAGGDATYCEIQSDYGHDAFLLEHQTQEPLVRSFLQRVYQQNREGGDAGAGI